MRQCDNCGIHFSEGYFIHDKYACDNPCADQIAQTQGFKDYDDAFDKDSVVNPKNGDTEAGDNVYFSLWDENDQ